MELSPRVVREVEFREKLRGYHPDDVDEFLERIAAGIEVLQDKLREAQDKAYRFEQRASEMSEGDDAIRRTLLLAQKTADLAVQEARDQAAVILAEADEQARAVLATAEQQAHELIRAGQAQLRDDISRLEAARDQLTGELATIARYLEDERNRLRRALTDALAQVDQTVPGVTPAPSPAPLDLPPETFVPPVAVSAD